MLIYNKNNIPMLKQQYYNNPCPESYAKACSFQDIVFPQFQLIHLALYLDK